MTVQHRIPKVTALIALLAGALVIFAYYYQTAGGQLPLSGSHYTVYAQVQDPQGLLNHADVRAAGVKIGSVEGITNENTPDGVVARVQMQFTGSFDPIYKDATILIRQKTLVGENYIQITRGVPKYGAVPNNGTLPVTQDLEAVPLDQILNSLTGPVRRNVESDLQSLGAGLKGQGEHLNQFLGALEPTVQAGNTVLSILNDQKQQVASLVSQSGTVLQALADRTQELRDMVSDGTATAQAFANRDTALEHTLADLPSTLAQARTSVTKLSSFSQLASPVVSNLRVAFTNLQPVIDELGPTATSAKALFADLGPFVKVANPLLTKLASFSRAAVPAVPSLSDALRQVDPAFAYLKPYYKDAGSFLQNFGGGLMKQNATGDYMGRCLCPVSYESYSGLTANEQLLLHALINAGGLGGIANPGWNALRAPGTAPNASTPFSGSYPRIQEAPPVKLSK